MNTLKGRGDSIILGLSFLLILSGIGSALAWIHNPDSNSSIPNIEFLPGDYIAPYGTITFRIHLYLVKGEPPTTPSNLNDYLIRIVLPDPRYPAPAIRVWDPNGVEHRWDGGPIVVSGGPPANNDIYVDIKYGTGQPGWWPPADTSIGGKYKVDFAGRFYTTKEDYGWKGSRNFNIPGEFWQVPEFPTMSATLIISGLVLLILKNRVVKTKQ